MQNPLHRNVVLEEIVLETVSSLADYVRCYEPVFLYFLAMQNNAEHQINLKVLRQSIDKGEQRYPADRQGYRRTV